MEDDWDLQAVVRGCSSTSATSSATSATTSSFTTTPTWSFSSHNQQQLQGDNYFVGFPDLFQPRKSENSIEDLLTNLYNPSFFSTKPTKLPLSPPQSLPISPLSVLGGLQDLSPPPPPPQQQHQQQQQHQLYSQKQLQPKPAFGGSRSASTQNTRSKKKQEPVEEGLPSSC